MTPTAAVWSSRISLKRQGFSSTHCTKPPLTPTRMTTIPAGIDSHPDLSDIKGNQILSTGFCEGGQRREHPVQGRISQSAWERRPIGTASCSAFWNSLEQEQCDLRDNRAIQRRGRAANLIVAALRGRCSWDWFDQDRSARRLAGGLDRAPQVALSR